MTKPATMHPPVHPVSAAAAVTTVRELAAFDALRPAWDRLHAEDPDAGVFLGFGWLRRLFAENPGDWCVKLLTDPHDPSRLLAALPLRVQLRWSRSQKRFQTHFAAAGRLCFTEYTGFLCARGSEAAALDALGRHMAGQPWASFALRYEPTGRRLQAFARAMEGQAAFAVNWPEHRINGGETDQLICPQIALPENFETYLEGQSRNTRKKIRKTMRRYFDSGEVTPRVLEEVPYEEVRDALLSHWAARWREANSPERLEAVGAKYGRMLDRARDLGLLYMPSLWHQGRVVGALGFVIDPASGAYHCMVTGRDIEVQAIDLGLLMHAHAIEDVIGRGGTLYDFGHGTEPYKFHYATSTLELGNLVIERRAGGVFDPAMTGAALARCEQMLRRGQTEDLARALRQAFEIDPRKSDAVPSTKGVLGGSL